MRRIVLAGLGTVSSLVLLFAYPTSHNVALGDSSHGTAEASSGGTSSGGTSSGGTSSGGTSSGGTSSGGKTYTGDAADTRYGPVQVQITVTNGKITAADAIQYPNDDHHSARINSFAVPTLNSEAVAAQNAQIDAVSGATITSNAYQQSLQSALDAAHL